jgi:DNA modification methylase
MSFAPHFDSGGLQLRAISKKLASAPASVLESQEIEYVPISKLKLRQQNPRTHSSDQIERIARSIERFGFVSPVIIDRNKRVICGHGRIAGARLLGLESAPTITLEHLSDAELRAYVIADNRLAERAGWDKEILALELQGLLDLNFDVGITGFDGPELELIIDSDNQDDSSAEENKLPELQPARIVTKPNDLWILGEHRLFCADARNRESFTTLLCGDSAQLVFIDPPYNVKIRGHVSGKGRVKHREFAEASGEKTSGQFTKFLEDALALLAEHSADGAIHFVCSDWRHLDEMLAAGRRVYRELKNLVVWNKTNAGMGSFYRSQHELILVWKNGRGKHVNNIELGQHGRNRSNVWTYAGANSFGADRLDELAMHPTVKPVALVADAILDCSRRSDIVLDSFGGSGTTLIACERTRRQARLLEIDPIYCDQSIRRWQRITGQPAIHGATGRHFEGTSTRKTRRE